MDGTVRSVYLEADTADEALEQATKLADVLLANPVIEDYSVRLV